ncbi:MAG TPA: GNAT family N-acetyltransferase [Dehalococcoidia bacterium]|nr:GNAT family N-acetyltransferase [Dehalococcoidia bacterium]
MPEFYAAMESVLLTLAAENGCAPSDITDGDVRICERAGGTELSPLVRRYARAEPQFAAVTTGTGAVVSGSAVLMGALQELFGGCSRDAVFETARLAQVAALLASHGRALAGPYLRLVCGDDTWRDRPAPGGITVVVESYPHDERLRALRPERWPNAMSVPSRRPQPRLALALAADELVGVAAMSADTDTLWQIGLDVAHRHRGRGIGAALTSALAKEALGESRIPFYGVAFSNLPSIAAALAAGFRPAWVEAYCV